MSSKVYFTKQITPEGLAAIYQALGVELPGKVAVKVSTGEAGARGYLKADLIGPFVKSLNGTIVECNTAYDGERNTAADHLKVAEDHGFTSFAPVDILDATGEIKLPKTANTSNTILLDRESKTTIRSSISPMAKVT